MDALEVSVVPILLMEPTVAAVISTSMGKDQRMGAACVSIVTASMEIMNLETLSVAVGHQGLQWRNWQKKTWQRAAPNCVTHHLPFSSRNCVDNAG